MNFPPIRHRFIPTLACVAALGSAAAHAEWYGVMGLALAQGGETAAHVSYADGSSDALKFGQWVELRTGVAYQFRNSRWGTQLTVGYQKVNSDTGKGNVTRIVYPYAHSSLTGNAAVSYSQVPVDWMALYDLNPDWRLGVGLRRVLNARVNTEATGTSLGDFEFKASTRPVLQANWLINQRIGVYLRHARTSYRYSSSQGSVKLDGTQTALGIDFWF